jgi:hypothetical protein
VQRAQAPENFISTYIRAVLFIIHIVAYFPKARAVKPAETAAARERLCKHACLLGNRFATPSDGVTGKRCFLRGSCDSYVMQQ